MSEYINKETVLRALDDAMRVIATEGTEIIRCKDCRYWQEQGLCTIWDHYIANSEFYCGCAERRRHEHDTYSN